MPELDCQKCKRWKHCPGKEWYHYGEIRWCPRQVIWILQNADTLDAGMWVVDKNLTDESDQRAMNEAYYVKSKIAIAEVRDRLKTTGVQGELLVEQVQNGKGLLEISDSAYEALMYVKGWRRKEQDFLTWKRKRRHQQKGTDLSIKCDLTK